MLNTTRNEDLTEQQRQYGLHALLVYTFFMVIGFSMLMPLVAVHFVNNLGMAAALVGMALAVRQLTQQGLALVGGVFSDRFGARLMICLGVLLRALGFASLGFATDSEWLFAAMVLSALGGALFEAPYQAAIATLATKDNRARYYTLSNWISGIASTLGPLVGAFLLRFDFKMVCLIAAACFALNFMIALRLPPIHSQSAKDGQPAPHSTDSCASQPAKKENKSFTQGLALVKRDRPFLCLTGVMMGYWFTAVQINITFPLLAEKLTHSQESVGVMFAVNAMLTILLQYPLVKWMHHCFSVPQTLIAGMVIMAIGTGAVGWVSGFPSFLLCVALFSIGAVLVRPSLQTLIASMANPQALGTFLGVSSLSLAVGGALGNVAGGWLIEFAALKNWFQLPWMLFAGMGLLSAFGLFLLVRTKGEHSLKVSRY